MEMSRVTGINNSIISRLESGDKKTIDNKIMAKLADVFEVSIDYLFGKVENSDPVGAGSEFRARFDLGLSEDDLIKKFKLEVDGKELSDEQAKAAITILRSLLKTMQ